MHQAGVSGYGVSHMDVFIDAGPLWTASHSEHISITTKESFIRPKAQVKSVLVLLHFFFFFAILFHIIARIRHFEPGDGMRTGE